MACLMNFASRIMINVLKHLFGWILFVLNVNDTIGQDVNQSWPRKKKINGFAGGR